MTIRVMIVDDEFLVRMGIASLIVWEDYGYEIVAEAENGEDALEKIEKFRPHIVLTDLMMKHGDGFYLIETCMERYKEIRFIVMSNYNDFDNVRKAMKLGARDYIFKLTLNKNELLDALKEAGKGLKIETGETENEKKGNQNVRLVKTELLKNLLSARDQHYEKVLKNFQQVPMCVELKSKYHVMLVLIDNFRIIQRKGDFLENDLLKFTMENMIRELFGQEEKIEIFSLEEYHFILVFSAEQELKPSELSEKFEQLNKAATQYYGFKLSGTIGPEHRGVEEFRAAVQENYDASKKRFWNSTHELIWFDKLEETKKIEADSFGLLKEQALDECLRREGVAAGLDYMEQQLERLATCTDLDSWEIRKMLIRTSRILMYYIGKQKIDFDRLTDHQQIDFETAVNEYDYLEDIQKNFKEIHQQCLEMLNLKPRLERTEIQEAKQYVKAHLNEKFSIAQIAEKVSMSESRFSHVFKKETGMTFWEFVNLERMNLAEELLTETNLRISDIAEQIGMENPNYFSTQFKKKNGVSPLEYRKIR